MSAPMSADMISCRRRCSRELENVSADVSRHGFHIGETFKYKKSAEPMSALTSADVSR